LLAVTSVPLVRYAMKDRNERAAIQILERLHAAEHAFHDDARAYAADLAALRTPCGRPPITTEDLAGALEGLGYELHVRAAEGAGPRGTDCQGRALASDYLATAAPASVWSVARQAFAMRSDGRIYLFYDGVPPTEQDIADGLATPVEARETFTIP
jgi:hypothetical protein